MQCSVNTPQICKWFQLFVIFLWLNIGKNILKSFKIISWHLGSQISVPVKQPWWICEKRTQRSAKIDNLTKHAQQNGVHISWVIPQKWKGDQDDCPCHHWHVEALAPSQWETSLQSNALSNWLGHYKRFNISSDDQGSQPGNLSISMITHLTKW